MWEIRECGRLGSAGRVIVKWDLLYAARNFNFVFISFSCFQDKVCMCQQIHGPLVGM